MGDAAAAISVQPATTTEPLPASTGLPAAASGEFSTAQAWLAWYLKLRKGLSKYHAVILGLTKSADDGREEKQV